MKILWFFGFLLLTSTYLQSQDTIPSTQENHFVKDTKLEGELRNFLMQTNNTGNLTDYYTNATGLYLGLNSGNWKGIQMHVGGRYITKTFSSDIAETDTQTEQFTKWEFELYDVLNRDNFNFLILEELYLNYQNKNTQVQLGNMFVETPMFSASDGRMHPFTYRGVKFNQRLHQKHIFNFWWLTHTLVRSTTEWFNNNDAIGLITNGFQPDGQVANYQNQYNSRGSGIFKYAYIDEGLAMEFYQFHLDDIMTMSFVEFRKNIEEFNFGLQYSYQYPLKSNRDLDYVNRYMQPDERPQVISTRVRYSHSNYQFTGAYSYSLSTGRMLFPKELGRDWYYTSTARSRMEGLGDAHNFLLKGEYYLPKNNLYFGLEYIQMLGPEVNNYTLNKYNIDEYWQINARIRYDVNFLKGVNFDLLYIIKQNLNNHDPINVFNRSDYSQFNFVTNIYF